MAEKVYVLGTILAVPVAPSRPSSKRRESESIYVRDSRIPSPPPPLPPLPAARGNDRAVTKSINRKKIMNTFQTVASAGTLYCNDYTSRQHERFALKF